MILISKLTHNIIAEYKSNHSAQYKSKCTTLGYVELCSVLFLNDFVLFLKCTIFAAKKKQNGKPMFYS